MEKHNICSHLQAIFAILLLSVSTGVVYADESNFCTTSCASNLKQCRDQADTLAFFEANPMVTEIKIMENLATHNGRSASLAEQIYTPKIEIEIHKNERYQQCESENANCLHRCSPEQPPIPSTPKKKGIGESGK